MILFRLATLGMVLGATMMTSCQWHGLQHSAKNSSEPGFKVHQPEYDQARLGETTIRISRAEQRLELLSRAGKVLLESDASTGVPQHETPAGSFTILEKLPNKRSNLYGRYVNAETGEIVVREAWKHVGPKPPGTVYRGIAMPYWMRVTWDGVGIHEGKFPRGMRSSHGCIRMPMEAQKLIFAKTQVGTPVTIE